MRETVAGEVRWIVRATRNAAFENQTLVVVTGERGRVL